MSVETTKVLFFLAISVVVIVVWVFVPYSLMTWRPWTGQRGLEDYLPERIRNTRWYRGVHRGTCIVLVLVLVYGWLFLGWKDD